MNIQSSQNKINTNVKKKKKIEKWTVSSVPP